MEIDYKKTSRYFAKKREKNIIEVLNQFQKKNN